MVRRTPAAPENPWGNAIGARSTLLETRAGRAARRRRRRAAGPGGWSTGRAATAWGSQSPTGCFPGPTPTLLATRAPASGRRAAFATHNLWVTPYDPEERRAAGTTLTSTGRRRPAALDGADRPIVDTDVVLWHTFGVTHVPRPEDWPVMPVEYAGFSLVPIGLLRPQPRARRAPSADHCHD